MSRRGEAQIAGIDRAEGRSNQDVFGLLLDRGWRSAYKAEMGVLRLIEITMRGAGGAYCGGGRGEARTKVLRILKMQIAKLDEARGLLIAAGKVLDKDFRP